MYVHATSFLNEWWGTLQSYVCRGIVALLNIAGKMRFSILFSIIFNGDIAVLALAPRKCRNHGQNHSFCERMCVAITGLLPTEVEKRTTPKITNLRSQIEILW